MTKSQQIKQSRRNGAAPVQWLAELSAAMQRADNSKSLAHTLDMLCEGMGARQCLWYSLDGDNAKLQATAGNTRAETFRPPARLKLGNGEFAQLSEYVQDGEPHAARLGEFAPGERELLRGLGAAGAMVVPLREAGEIRGMLLLTLPRGKAEPAGDELSALRTAGALFEAACQRLHDGDSLRRSEAKLRTILRSSIEYGIITTDSDFNVQQLNPAAETIFSTGGDAEGHPVHELIGDKAFAAKALEKIHREVAKRGSWEKELELPAPPQESDAEPASPLLVQVVVTAMQDDGAEPGGYLIFARDVTYQRRRERRLLDSQRMESVGLLAGGIAHDFNNILMGILGYASLAQDLVEPDHPATRMLSTIEQSAERAASLTSQLMAYCRGGKLTTAPIDTGDLIAETLNILGSNLPAAVSVHRQHAENVPNVLGDPTQLQQVVMNLVLNAAEAIVERIRTQHAGKSGGNITITTKATRLSASQREVFGGGNEPLSGNFVLIRVQDDGSGMSPETLRRVFEPFFTTKFTGRGLGLAAVQGIIHNHGGGMTVRSTPGVGTTFSIYLPATKRLADPLRTPAPISVEGDETVLIIDDETVARQLGLLTLANLGYQVLLAASGEEGVDTFRQYQSSISLVILDLTMPGMASEDVLAELAMMEHQVPVLLTSGYDESSVADVAGGKYLTGFLQKPYTPEVLAKAVREILDKYAPQRK